MKTRSEIIADHPIVDFVRARGRELKQSGTNFVTNGCPITEHKRGHRPVTIDPAKQVWHCNDCGKGGSVIDWVMCDEGCTFQRAIEQLGAATNPAASNNNTKPKPRPKPALKSKEVPAFDWSKCVSAMSDKHIKHIAEWRGYSIESETLL